MAKINDTTTYPNTTPALTDHVPGTDVSNTTNDANGETVTFTLQAVSDLVVAQAPIGLEFIATADASGDASIDFTESAFDSTKYDSYMFVFGNIIPVTDNGSLRARTGTVSGFASGASDYANTVTNNTGSVLASQATAGTSSMALGSSIGNAAGEEGLSGTAILSNPHLAKRTMLTLNTGLFASDGTFHANTGACIRLSSTAVTRIQFLMQSGNISSGTITMYGMRNA